jgi:hypothetical protein
MTLPLDVADSAAIEAAAERVTMLQLSAFNTPQFDWAKSRLALRPFHGRGARRPRIHLAGLLIDMPEQA